MGLLKSFPNQRTFYPPYLYAHNLLFENGVQALLQPKCRHQVVLAKLNLKTESL